MSDHRNFFTGMLVESSSGDLRPQEVLEDLHLDQVIAAVTAGSEELDLITGLLSHPLHDAATVVARQEVFRDLDDHELRAGLQRFTSALAEVRAHLRQCAKMRNRHQQNGWLLAAGVIYCDAVRALADVLTSRHVRSAGLISLRDWVVRYVASDAFTALVAQTDDRTRELAEIRYCVRIKSGRVEVSRYENEADFSAEILKTFARFEQGAVKDYRVKYRTRPGMTHINEQILDRIARLFGDEFSRLEDYASRYGDLIEPTIRDADRGLQFYLSYLAFIAPLLAAGLEFCYPEVTDAKDVFATGTFDIALAAKLVGDGGAVVPNGFQLSGPERIAVVSGPNQGGKTTFARTFGQLHHLAGVGCPVPGSAARLLLCDAIYTHFGREEHLETMSGKLEEDLVRIRGTLREATPRSIVIMNEIFGSTTLADARFVGRRVLDMLVELDLLGVFVTFVDELARIGPSVVSMVSTVDPDDPVTRTFRVVRAPADGLAYALAIAEKYGLTEARLRQRIGS